MKKCEHHNIVIIQEQPIGLKNGKLYLGIIKKFVECEDCGIELPIYRITNKVKNVPIN